MVLFFRLPGGAMHAMYRYSPRSDSWSLITRLGERASCAIASCNNKLFITGGRDNKNQVISTVMCWDVDRGILTEECALPMGVSHHGSVTLMKSYTHIHRITPAPASQWHRHPWTKTLLQTEWKNVMSFFFKCYSFKHYHQLQQRAQSCLRRILFIWNLLITQLNSWTYNPHIYTLKTTTTNIKVDCRRKQIYG